MESRAYEYRLRWGDENGKEMDKNTCWSEREGKFFSSNGQPLIALPDFSLRDGKFYDGASNKKTDGETLVYDLFSIRRPVLVVDKKTDKGLLFVHAPPMPNCYFEEEYLGACERSISKYSEKIRRQGDSVGDEQTPRICDASSFQPREFANLEGKLQEFEKKCSGIRRIIRRNVLSGLVRGVFTNGFNGGSYTIILKRAGEIVSNDDFNIWLHLQDIMQRQIRGKSDNGLLFYVDGENNLGDSIHGAQGISEADTWNKFIEKKEVAVIKVSKEPDGRRVVEPYDLLVSKEIGEGHVVNFRHLRNVLDVFQQDFYMKGKYVC